MSKYKQFKKFDEDKYKRFKEIATTLADEIGFEKACQKLQISHDLLYSLINNYPKTLYDVIYDSPTLYPKYAKFMYREQAKTADYKEYQNLLNKYDGEAEYNLGLIHQNRYSDYYDLKKAFEYFEKGTIKRNIKAALQLSKCYEKGYGVNTNTKKAFEIILSFQDEYEIARCYMGLLYQYGIGVKKNPKKAVKIFSEFIGCKDENINQMAQICLAVCYFHGEGVKKDIKLAEKLFQADPEIYSIYVENCIEYYGVALIYKTYFDPCEFLGRYFKPDLKKYFSFMQKGYEETNQSRYANELGTIYLFGSDEMHVKKNINKASKYFSNSILKNSQIENSIISFYNSPRNHNNIDVLTQFSLHAQCGSSKSNLFMGFCYYHGYFTEQNISKAKEHFNAAATNDDYFGKLGLAISAILKATNTEDYFLYFEEIKEDLNIASKSSTKVSLINSIWFDSFFCPDSFPILAKYLIELIEFTFKRIYLKNQFVLKFDEFSLSVRMLFYLWKYRSKESNKKTFEIFNKYRLLVKQQENEILILKRELNKKENQLNDKEKYIEEMASIHQRLDSIENKIQDVMNFISLDLSQKIITYKQELNKKFEEYSSNLIQAQGNKNMQELKEMFDNEREELIASFNSNISEYINKNIKITNADIEKERKYLENVFGRGWEKLQSSSQTSLISAGVLWKCSENITDETFDFSGVCISATSALESELKKWFFIKFQDYISNKYGEPNINDENTYDNWPDQLLTISKYEYLSYKKRSKIRNDINLKKTKFFIGAIPYIFCTESVSGGAENEPRNKLLIERLEEYLSTIISDQYSKPYRDLFTQNNTNIGMSIIECCELIRKQYRNPSAHIDVVDRTTAEDCYHKVIGKIATYNYTHNVTGLLIELMNLLK